LPPPTLSPDWQVARFTGNHNRSIKGWNLIDPPLNESGIAQVTSLHKDLGSVHGILRSVEAVIVSPLARAI
jgi:broad specificity phosphatase PhoE